MSGIFGSFGSTFFGTRSTVPKPTMKERFVQKYKEFVSDDIDPPQPTITPPVEQELIDNSANTIELEYKTDKTSIVKILKIKLPNEHDVTEFRIGDKITTKRFSDIATHQHDSNFQLSEPIQCIITEFTTDGKTPSSIKVQYSSIDNDTGNPILKDDTIKLNTDLLLRPPPFRSNPAFYGALLWTKIQKVSSSSKGGAKRKRSKSAKRRKRNHRRHSRKHTK